MADSIFAAASTTPPSSSERIASEFMAQGNPAPVAHVNEGITLGGFEIKTPKVGDGFTEWAISGYDLEGKTRQVPPEVCYDKHGDWMFDKTSVAKDSSQPSQGDIYDNNYAPKEK